MLLDLLNKHYPKVLGNLILKYYYNCNEDDNIYNIYDICKQGAIALVNIDGLNKYQLNYGLFGACFGGRMQIVKLMIEKGANDFNLGLNGACLGGHLQGKAFRCQSHAVGHLQGKAFRCQSHAVGHLQGKAFLCQSHAVGHLQIVKLMVKKGADNFNLGLYYACSNGHMEIAELMIEKGADNFNSGLYYACFGGHMEIVKLMIEKGANDFNWGLGNACLGGNMEIVKLIIEKGATRCYNCDNTKHPELLP